MANRDSIQTAGQRSTDANHQRNMRNKAALLAPLLALPSKYPLWLEKNISGGLVGATPLYTYKGIN
jgi:hypothetical protein